MKKYLVLILFLFSSICLFADYPSGNDLNINGSVLGYDNTSKKWRPIAVDANGNIQSGGTTIDNISVDTSNIETYLKKTDGGNTVTITDLINGIGTDTSNLSSALNIEDKSVTELVNGIGTDTTNIENDLRIDDKTITEIVNGIGTDTGKIYTDVSIIKSNVSSMLNDTSAMSNNLYDIEAAIKHINNHSVAVNWATSRKSIEPNTVTNLGNLSASISGGSNQNSSRVCLEIRAINTDDEFYIGFDSNITSSTGRPVKGRILLNINKNQSVYIVHTNNSAMAIQQTEGWAAQL